MGADGAWSGRLDATYLLVYGGQRLDDHVAIWQQDSVGNGSVIYWNLALDLRASTSYADVKPKATYAADVAWFSRAGLSLSSLSGLFSPDTALNRADSHGTSIASRGANRSASKVAVLGRPLEPATRRHRIRHHLGRSPRDRHRRHTSRRDAGIRPVREGDSGRGNRLAVPTSRLSSLRPLVLPSPRRDMQSLSPAHLLGAARGIISPQKPFKGADALTRADSATLLHAYALKLGRPLVW